MLAYAKHEQKQEYKSTQKKESEKKLSVTNQTGIPDAMKARVENHSGFSFDDVRVHYNSGKPAQLQALAYTQGNQVYVAPGQERHLGHELGHVAQQKEGIVKPRINVRNMGINDDKQLELDAVRMFSRPGGHTQKASAESDVIQAFKMPKGNTRADAEALLESIRGDINNDVVGRRVDNKLNTQENRDVLLPITVPDIGTIALSKQGDNVATITQIIDFIQHDIFETGKKSNYNDYLKKTLSRLKQGAKDLEGDINFWRSSIIKRSDSFITITDLPPNTTIKKLDVEEVKLTGSDLHERGLGTAFVKFRASAVERRPRQPDVSVERQFDVVVKPDQRVIEESLLSDRPDSLANKFNTYHWSLDGEDISGEQRIKTIPMKTSSEYGKDHGTIIKKIVGRQLNQIEGIHPIANIKAVAFACFAGIADLHRENVIYEQEPGPQPVLIDADVAMSQEKLLDTEKTRKQSGFSLGPRQTPPFRIDAFSPAIIRDVKDAFRGKFGRIVPIPTADLQFERFAFLLSDKKQREDLLEGHVQKLRVAFDDMMVGNVETAVSTKDCEKNETQKDYQQGQLPLYTYWYDSGHIKHNNKVIAKSSDLDETIEFAIMEWREGYKG